MFFVLVIVFTLLVLADGSTAGSICGQGKCRNSAVSGCVTGSEAACGCVSSVHGALCTECSSRGFLDFSVSPAICKCLRPYYDPSAACLPVADYSATQTVTARSSRFTCTAWANTATGFFLQPDNDAHTYGTPDPPIVNQCLRDPWGPAPGAFVDSLVPGTFITVCNTFGGFDPNAVAGQNDTSFVTCAGHGPWNPAPVYRCGSSVALGSGCDAGWALRDTNLQGLDGNTVPLCDTCAPFFGPPPGFGVFQTGGSVSSGQGDRGPFCNVVWTPFNETGTYAECGGRGTFNGVPGSTGACTCFNNGTLATISQNFEVLVYSSTTGTATQKQAVTVAVETCL